MKYFCVLLVLSAHVTVSGMFDQEETMQKNNQATCFFYENQHNQNDQKMQVNNLQNKTNVTIKNTEVNVLHQHEDAENRKQCERCTIITFSIWAVVLGIVFIAVEVGNFLPQ